MILIWYKYIYDFLFQTEPLYNNAFLDWIFPALVVALLYDFSFNFVGKMYQKRIIRSRTMGSIIHWGIRYGMMWCIIKGLIFIKYNWFIIIISIIILLAIIIVILRVIDSKN